MATTKTKTTEYFDRGWTFRLLGPLLQITRRPHGGKKPDRRKRRDDTVKTLAAGFFAGLTKLIMEWPS